MNSHLSTYVMYTFPFENDPHCTTNKKSDMKSHTQNIHMTDAIISKMFPNPNVNSLVVSGAIRVLSSLNLLASRWFCECVCVCVWPNIQTSHGV